MNKFKKYFKENYKRILLIILIILGYIGLLFACKYANNEIKENIDSINISYNKKRSNTRHHTLRAEQIQIGYYQDYISSIDIDFSNNNLNEYDGYMYIINQGVFTPLNYVDIDYSKFSYSLASSTTYYVDILYDNQIFCVDYTSFLYDYNHTSTNKLYTGVRFFVYHINNRTSGITRQRQDLYYTIDNNGLTLRSTEVNNSNVPFNFKVNTTYIYSKFGLLESNIVDTDSIYNDGYNDGYNAGYDVGKNDGYDLGYTDGVYNATNTLSNFDETTLDTLYYTDTDRVVNDANIPFSINGNTYNLNSEVATLKDDRIYNGDGSDGGTCIIVISDISPILITSLEFTIIGFYKVEFGYTDSTLEVFNVSDFRTNTTLTPIKEKLLDSIGLYFNANLDLNDYSLSLFDKNNYLNGYQNGYSDGFENGKNDVLNNLNNYDLYDKEQYIDYGESQKEIGINIGKTEGCSVNNLFFAIADIPTTILSSILSFELFGINMFVAFGSIATLLLIIWVIRKVK